ncbi:MAG TPA: LuxR C-terminal-related transcriptional regulator [Streptosporangiaceae bacterium]|nr:LuxR C-terminal-related transcriptional regulator [Streptosporangiaceae bacterium]
MLDDQPIGADFATFLHSHTDGIPFAVEETLRLMRDRADIVCLDGEWKQRERSAINVPPTVRDAILEHVQRLSTTAQSLLHIVAVLGSGEGEDILATISDLPLEDTRTGLRQCLESGLLREESSGRLAFRHALASRAVYESIPGVERRRLHQRAGLALENAVPHDPGKLTRHFRESNDHARWAQYAEQAAHLALASGDEMAATFLLYDVVVNADLPANLVVHLVNPISFSAFPNDSYFRNIARALDSALEAGPLGVAEKALARYQLGRMFVALDDYSSAQEQFIMAVPGLEPSSEESVRAMSLLGWPRGTVLDRAAHLSWLDRAAEQMGPSIRSVYDLTSAVNIITARLMLGDEAGWELLGRLPEPSSAREELQKMRAEWNAGDMAMRWGRYAKAREQLTRARQRSVKHGRTRQENEITVSLAHLDWSTGKWDGLAERLENLAHSDLDQGGMSELLCITGLLDFAQGAATKAEPRLLESFRQSQSFGNMENAVEPAAALARIYLANDRVNDAIELTLEGMDSITLKGLWIYATDIVPVRAAALAAIREHKELNTLVMSFAESLADRGAPAAHAALKVTEGILAEAQGRYPHAAGLFAEASQAWQALPRPYDALLAQERESVCLLAAGQDDAAKTKLASTFESLYRLGARGDASRLKKTLRNWGVAARWPGRGGRPSYGNQLSPREADVVRLLIDGRTNRQIADVLVLSTQTVASHLHSAMRKLGVSSRTALAVRASELGMAEPASTPGTHNEADT